MKVLSTISASLMLATSFTVAQNANADTVHLQKATTDFAIDGNRGSNGEGQQVYLFDANRNNVNQQWTEHDRGRGYYSYQKVRTSLCLDGGNGVPMDRALFYPSVMIPIKINTGVKYQRVIIATVWKSETRQIFQLTETVEQQSFKVSIYGNQIAET